MCWSKCQIGGRHCETRKGSDQRKLFLGILIFCGAASYGPRSVFLTAFRLPPIDRFRVPTVLTAEASEILVIDAGRHKRSGHRSVAGHRIAADDPTTAGHKRDTHRSGTHRKLRDVEGADDETSDEESAPTGAEMDLHQVFEIEGSVWDACIFIGTRSLGFSRSIALVAMTALTALIQAGHAARGGQPLHRAISAVSGMPRGDRPNGSLSVRAAHFRSTLDAVFCMPLRGASPATVDSTIFTVALWAQGRLTTAKPSAASVGHG